MTVIVCRRDEERMSPRMPLTPIGTDIESIIIAVVTFMICGLLIFVCCFVITQVYLRCKHIHWKKNQRSKQKNGEFQFASKIADPEFRRSFYLADHSKTLR